MPSAHAAESLFFGYSEHTVAAARQLLTGHQVVVEKKTPSAVMSGRVMAVLDCKDGFVVTSQNYCKIPVLGYALCLLQRLLFVFAFFARLHRISLHVETLFRYVHVRSFKGGKLELTKPASSFSYKHPTFVFGDLIYSES